MPEFAGKQAPQGNPLGIGRENQSSFPQGLPVVGQFRGLQTRSDSEKPIHHGDQSPPCHPPPPWCRRSAEFRNHPNPARPQTGCEARHQTLQFLIAEAVEKKVGHHRVKGLPCWSGIALKPVLHPGVHKFHPLTLLRQQPSSRRCLHGLAWINRYKPQFFLRFHSRLEKSPVALAQNKDLPLAGKRVEKSTARLLQRAAEHGFLEQLVNSRHTVEICSLHQPFLAPPTSEPLSL